MEKYIQIILEDGRKINCELYEEHAPKSVELFLNNIKNGRYNGTIFHRIIKNFMIQGGGYYVKDMTLYEVEEQQPISGEFDSYKPLPVKFKRVVGSLKTSTFDIF